MSVSPTAAACPLGRTPSASNLPETPLTEVVDGSNSEIWSGQDAEADDTDKKLDENLPGSLSEEKRSFITLCLCRRRSHSSKHKNKHVRLSRHWLAYACAEAYACVEAYVK